MSLTTPQRIRNLSLRTALRFAILIAVYAGSCAASFGQFRARSAPSAAPRLLSAAATPILPDVDDGDVELDAPGSSDDEPSRSDRLREPDGESEPEDEEWEEPPERLFQAETFSPLGFAGPSGVAPSEWQENSHFVPVEDRWRIGFPDWDRLKKGHGPLDDYPYVEGHWWDPYNQNVLKGDYPIYGQNTFLVLTPQLQTLLEPRAIPRAGQPGADFNQLFTNNFLRLGVELFHGTGAFAPPDWQVRIMPVFNLNALETHIPGVVSANDFGATFRLGGLATIEEYWFDARLPQTSANFDFASVRVGSQPFTSDFRGFIFSDTNRAIRLYGNRNSNREQFNVALFWQAEKDRFSQLNTLAARNQQILIANYYVQDFLFLGYNAEASLHWNHDDSGRRFDDAGFQARPDPIGANQTHRVEAVYLGLAGDGHIGRINVSNALYWVTGMDSLNPLAAKGQHINAGMAMLELSYDWDWVRFRTSGFWASGDGNPNDGIAGGFDSIFDNPNFAGGNFSYWQRQQMPLKGVSLVNRFSLEPDLRTSKFQGQSNFVNPGLRMVNAGMDFSVTPKSKLFTNVNYLWFDQTATLEKLVGVTGIARPIGLDTSLGIEYRPLLNNNIIVTAGVAGLFPGGGLKRLYDPAGRHVPTLYSSFIDVLFLY